MRRRTPLVIDDIQPEHCTTDLRLHILRGIPFLADLTDQDIAAVNQLARESGYEAGEMIYFTGDRAAHWCVVASGKVKLLRHTASGQDVLLDILKLGEFFGSLGALDYEAYPETAQALTPCCVLRIAVEDFKAMLRRYPSVALAVLDIVANRLTTAHEMVRQLSAHSVEQRVAVALLKLAEKLGEAQPDGLLIQVPLSRQDLAALTGTTTETVSRVMSQFREARLIQSGRQWVAITDLSRLRAIAEGV